ncbi:MAG: 2-C-methyl-D-erythritol 4-phosphate cytidylyltransferase [Planctomycetaceae bacterium]|nr:2-C-methyl-D-erythritol 4-phosphate cytidylyltransferase [Planctomycetaceae bacterium]
MSRFAVILPAAGKSTRFGDARRKKPFADLKGRPVWVRTAEAFVNREDVVQTLVCIAAEDMEWFKEKFAPNLAFMNVEIMAGGPSRADTVERALARVKQDADFVAVHDAARPLIVKRWIDAVFAAAEQHGAAIPAIPLSSTVKRVDRQQIVETVDRSSLWAAQTPQVFARQVLLDAYAKRDGFEATDEAQLVERIGQSISVVEGWPMNLKITTQDDFRMAEALLSVLPQEKSLGALHPFSDERFL